MRSTWLRPWGRARSPRPHQRDGVEATGGCPDNPCAFGQWVAFPFHQACSCALGFLPWPLAHLRLLGRYWIPIYPPDFNMATWPSGAGQKRKSNQDQPCHSQGPVQNENVGSLFKKQEKVPFKILKSSVFLSLRISSAQTHAHYSIRPHLTDSSSKIK